MKEYLKKVFIAGLLVACTVAGVFVFQLLAFAPQYLMNYNASILDKIDRLKEIDEPALILVGNSNLAFGIDSELIEETLGMPVVNLGLHGGLGNKFHENIAKCDIDPGDIVVVCNTNYADPNLRVADYSLVWITIENHFELWPLVPPEEWPKMIAALPSYLDRIRHLWLSGEGNRDDGTVYSRTAFNEYGDIAWDRPESMYVWEASSTPQFDVGDKTIENLNRFNSFCEKRGATLLIAGFPVGNGKFTGDTKKYTKPWAKLKASVDCPVISDIEDYFFDYSLFYDTNYHLIDRGAELRTMQLIRDLKEWQGSAN